MSVRLHHVVVVSFVLVGCSTGESAPPAVAAGADPDEPRVNEGASLLEHEKYAPHCSMNDALAGDAVCGRSRAECKRIAAMAPGVYAKKGVAAAFGACRAMAEVWCFEHDGRDRAWWHESCHVDEQGCASAWKHSPFVVESECRPVGRGPKVRTYLR